MDPTEQSHFCMCLTSLQKPLPLQHLSSLPTFSMPNTASHISHIASQLNWSSGGFYCCWSQKMHCCLMRQWLAWWQASPRLNAANLVSLRGYYSVTSNINIHKTFRNMIIFHPALTVRWNLPSGSKGFFKKKKLQGLLNTQIKEHSDQLS